VELSDEVLCRRIAERDEDAFETLVERFHRFQSLSPEQRSRVMQNWQRWREMPPDERRQLRERWWSMTPEERRASHQRWFPAQGSGR
jgi:hypothetical protein